MRFQVGKLVCELSLDESGRVLTRWFLKNGRRTEAPKYLAARERRQYRAGRDAFLRRVGRLPARLGPPAATWRTLQRIAPVLLVAALLAGCATITKGTTQVVAVNTSGGVGATCTLTSPAIGAQSVVTPDTITLAKGRDNISVRCTKECYQDGAGVISSSFESMSAGNIIVGGLIGFGVDAASGAMNNYTPEIQVVMTPIPGCRARTTQLTQ
jgi:hypothetical protein